MKKIVLIILFAGIVTTVSAQQLQTSSFYDMQGIIHNPSMAGSNGSIVGATYRSQWSGISGSPKTATVFGSFDLPNQNIGIGGYLFNDKTGPTSRTGVQVSFAKHIPTANGGRFSLGIEAKGMQYALDRVKLSQTLGSDPALGTADNKFKFDAGFGISYTGKKLQLGVSVAQLVQSITPNFMAVYLPNAPLEFQGGVKVEHNEIFWWGVAYRAHQSFILSAGVNPSKKFTIGYSFDIYNTPISVFDAGSNAHEILLRYNIFK